MCVFEKIKQNKNENKKKRKEKTILRDILVGAVQNV